MTYLITSQTPSTLEEFEAVDAAIGDRPPAGLLARYLGVTDAGVAVTALWASKADADRFFVEQLRPALRQVAGVDMPMPSQHAIGYEVTDEMLPMASR